MRVLTARIPDYGPLRSVELELDAGLNVVYGPNEAGKTSLLDFLLSHLFRWEERRGTRTETILEGMGRFGEPAEGSGSIELRLDGRIREYPGGPSLLHELEFEYAGLAGLFCVRSGEMELPEKEEGEFWAELKKVLSGLPEGVDTLREAAHAAAGLTRTTGRLSDAGSPGRKTEHRKLREREATLSGLTDRLDEVSEAAEEIAGLEGEKEELERARRARIARLSEALEETRQRLGEIRAVPRDALERWERLADERRRLEDEIGEARGGLEEARETLRERREARDAAERRVESLRGELRKARRSELETRARELEDVAPAGRLLRAADPLYWAGYVVLAAAVLTIFFTPSATLGRPATLLALGSALLVGAGLFFAGRGLRRRRDGAAEERAALLEAAAAAGLDAESPEELPAAVRRLESEVHEAEGKAEAAAARLESAEERVEERASALESRTSRLEAVGEEIEELRGALEAERLAAARERAGEREELEDRAEQIEAELQGLAGRDESAWSAEPPADADELPAWSASAYQEVEDRLRRLRQRHRELLRAFDRAGLAEPEDALTELQTCRSRIREIERDRDAGRLAAEIFATMDEALEERLASALSREGDHSVQGLLHRITSRYVELRRGDGGRLVARDERGRSFPLAHLSRGTRDQVHLALRLGLAGAALEAAELEEPGFFLLDDAFLTADWERRERLVEAASALAGEGWQLVYLTCDRHLRDLFTEAGARLHEL